MKTVQEMIEYLNMANPEALLVFRIAEENYFVQAVKGLEFHNKLFQSASVLVELKRDERRRSLDT